MAAEGDPKECPDFSGHPPVVRCFSDHSSCGPVGGDDAVQKQGEIPDGIVCGVARRNEVAAAPRIVVVVSCGEAEG